MKRFSRPGGGRAVRHVSRHIGIDERWPAMKRLFAMVLAVALVTAGTLAAQTTSGVLNTLEVQRLVAAGTPAAHVALSSHYMALAEMFATQAARFDALARAPSGAPNHPVTMGVNARHVSQAQAAMALSERAREMAAYHQFLSIGAPAAPPVDRATFDGGFAARTPTASELRAATAAARTAADHHVLEEYYMTVNARSAADAKAHAAMANNFRVSGQRRGSELAAMHCDRLAKQAREAAKDAGAAAALHRQLADIG